MITPAQIRLIKIAQREINMDDARYRAILKDKYGVESCTRLDAKQASDFIDFLKLCGFRIRKKPPEAKPASKKQLAFIAVLKKEVAWKYENGFELFLKKRFGLDKIRTAKEAYKVIEALKRMKNG